jgi:murein DD-endopeptidase MepM/ murein hydrolase activator NlpD
MFDMRRHLRTIIALIALPALIACATAYDRRGVYHRVQGGETIAKIARYYHVSVQDLAEWNNIESADEVQPDLKLYIPKIGKKPEKAGRAPRGRGGEAKISFDRSRFAWPSDGDVMSPFGIRNGKRHDGIDIKAKSGDPIKAAADGLVAYNGKIRGYGNLLIVRHRDNFFTVYAHNSKNKAKKGQKVAKGEVIGYVGATGRATGPHLHFEVREGQKARNPVFLLPAVGGKRTEMVASKDGGKKDEAKEVAKREGEKDAAAEEKTETAPKDKFSGRREMMEKLKGKK